MKSAELLASEDPSPMSLGLAALAPLPSQKAEINNSDPACVEAAVKQLQTEFQAVCHANGCVPRTTAFVQ